MNLFEQKLAEHKVYDAWQYVEAIMEYLNYMNSSFEMITKVYESRLNIINKINTDLYEKVSEEGKALLG